MSATSVAAVEYATWTASPGGPAAVTTPQPPRPSPLPPDPEPPPSEPVIVDPIPAPEPLDRPRPVRAALGG